MRRFGLLLALLIPTLSGCVLFPTTPELPGAAGMATAAGPATPSVVHEADVTEQTAADAVRKLREELERDAAPPAPAKK